MTVIADYIDLFIRGEMSGGKCQGEMSEYPDKYMRTHMYVFTDCLDNNGNCSLNETCVTDPKFAPTNRCICKQGYQKNRLWETCTGRCFKNNSHCKGVLYIGVVLVALANKIHSLVMKIRIFSK